MSKLAHSHQPTMDWIEFKAAIRDRKEDLIWEQLCELRVTRTELLAALEELFGTNKNEMVARGLPVEWQDDCAMARAERAIAKARGNSQ